MTNAQTSIAVRCAYIRVGYKGQYGATVSAAPLTTIDEAGMGEAELLALAESRLSAAVERIRAESPHYNIFQTEILVGEVAVRNPDFVWPADGDDDNE